MGYSMIFKLIYDLTFIIKSIQHKLNLELKP